MPAEAERQFAKANQIIVDALEDIETLPIIPREIEDILQISSTERHRWLKDGRLPSIGTRTVKLRGRAREVTFHVFDPRIVEDILDRDLVTDWREEDVAAAAENRRRAAWKGKLTRRAKSEADRPLKGTSANAPSRLVGWGEFERNGPLRKPNRN